MNPIPRTVTRKDPDGSQPLGLYLHIPFCERKCHYCDFLSRPGSRVQMEEYLDVLAAEAALHTGTGVDTVFVGGGTPSVLPPPLMERFLDQVLGCFPATPEAEVTLEANPESFSIEKGQLLRSRGVNRISFGVQSLDPEELASLGRIHTRDRAIEAYQEARTVGFSNLNVDLIYGFPSHRMESWKRTLRGVLALAPEHLSCYCFILEEDTAFFQSSLKGELPGIDEDLQVEMFEWTRETLTSSGYVHYEISNFARPGRECRHNRKYWRQEETLGLGVGAVSYRGGRRRANARNLDAYRRQVAQGRASDWLEDEMPRIERVKESVMLGLRMLAGVDLTALPEGPLSGEEQSHIEGILDPWTDKGLLERDRARYWFSKRGIFLSNDVFQELV